MSIKTDRESEFLHNLIKFRDVKLPVWLGAVQNDFSSFNWIDKSDVTFTNWAEGEPNDPDHACLSMTASGGKWSDNDCKEQKLILCQKAVPEDSSCETGWLQFRQDKCYRFVHIRLAFDDAESLCNNLYGGHLPSIHSQEEQFMISQFLASVNVKNGSEIWLGGRQMDFHNFNWGDGSLFNYSYWEHGEPNFPAEKCIEMSWRNGRWNDINCRLKRGVLCERQMSQRNHITGKPNLYQPINCLDSNCSTPLIGQSGAQSSNANTQVGSEFHLHTPNELGISQAANHNSTHQEVTTQSNVSSATLTSVTNRTNSASPVDESHIMLPPDDKPIKVITSIMHRDQPQLDPTFEALANGTASVDANTNNTFIHYNLPPPQAKTEQQQQQQHVPQQSLLNSKNSPEVVTPSNVSSPQAQEKSKEAPLVEQLSPLMPTPTITSSQQPFDLSNVPMSTASLMDKLKHANSSTSSIPSTTQTTLVE